MTDASGAHARSRVWRGSRCGPCGASCRATLPSVKLRGVRLVARKDLERALCPEPQTWPDGDEEMEEEQEIIE